MMEIVLDAETHDPNISNGKGAGWVYSDFEILGFAIKHDNNHPVFVTNRNDLERFVTNAKTIICHNAQYDIGCLDRLNIRIPNTTVIVDTMILMTLYDNSLRSYSLEAISNSILGEKKETISLEAAVKELKLRGKAQRHMRELFQHRRDLVETYALKDVELTRKIYDWLRKELYPEAIRLIPFYSDLIKALVKWRSKGIRVDLVQAEKSGDILDSLYKTEMEKFNSFCPNTNINSTKELSESFRSLGLAPGKTEKGNDSVDSKWRAKQDHPAIVALSNAVKYQKLKRDFIDGIIKRSENGRIYPEIHILGAAETGRFSSRNPNIQQCYDKETEILTEYGFKLFENLRQNDRVASWKEGEIEWTRFSNFVKYKSEYINIIKSPSIDLAITDYHRCIRMNKFGKYFLHLPKDYSYRGLYHIHSGMWANKPNNIFKEFIHLIFAIHSIGIVSKYGVDFASNDLLQNKTLFEACEFLNIKINILENIDRTRLFHGTIHSRIDLKYLPLVVWQYIHPISFEFTPKILQFSNSEIVKDLLLWYKTKDMVVQFKNKNDADIAQALITISNRTAFKKKDTCELYLKESMCSGSDSIRIHRIPYNDYVYCISVPSSFIITRRNGTTSVSGNCPARDELANKLVRSIFLPEEGHKWFSLDFSSQEPRVQLAYAKIARCNGVEELVREFEKNPKHDLHQQVADICKISRKEAKTINLAISYGMSQIAVSKILNISKKETADIFTKYNNLNPYLSEINKKVQYSGMEKGYIKSLIGRRMRIDAKAPYKSLNKLIQGGSSDMTAICLVKAYRENLPVMFSVHDSIELSSNNREDAEKMKYIMENSFKNLLPIPFCTDIKQGNNWGNLE